MSRKDPLKIVEGTVIAIPVSSGHWALSQVIFPGVKFYIGICSNVFNEPVAASDIAGCSFGMFSWTNDGEIFKGNWKNLGEYQIETDFELPTYKVMRSGKMIVVSFYGNVLREFDHERDSNLQYRTVRSPLLVQDAVQAACGHGEWKTLYDQMKIIT